MSGRTFAYAGAAVGLTLSMWANVTHAALQPGGASVGAMAMAAFWPLGLFLALEILTRTSWSGGLSLLAARSGLAVVGAVAAVVSYLHLHGLLVHYGERPLPATIGPLAIDGLMAVSAAALLTGTATRRTANATCSAPTDTQVSAPKLGPDDGHLASEPAPTVHQAQVGVAAPGPDITGTSHPAEVLDLGTSHSAEDQTSEPTPERGPATLKVTARRAAAAQPARRKVTASAVEDRSDDALLARIRTDVGAGELPSPVTPTSIRTRYGVGKTRGDRLVQMLAGQEVTA